MLETKNCKCGSNHYFIKLGISNLGKKDFMENCPDLDPELWIEAFDWIIIDLICAECGLARKSWFEEETM